MDIQDLQDSRPSDLQFVEITEKIIGCISCPSMFIHSVRKLMLRCLSKTPFHFYCNDDPHRSMGLYLL
jgi:hypothetical protein